MYGTDVLQIVLETDRQTLYFSVLHTEDLEAMISHMTASLKRIFPDSSPGWVVLQWDHTSLKANGFSNHRKHYMFIIYSMCF